MSAEGRRQHPLNRVTRHERGLTQRKRIGSECPYADGVGETLESRISTLSSQFGQGRTMRKGALANVTKTLLESRMEKTQIVRLQHAVSKENEEGRGRYSHDVDNELVEEDVSEVLSGVREQREDSSRLVSNVVSTTRPVHPNSISFPALGTRGDSLLGA